MNNVFKLALLAGYGGVPNGSIVTPVDDYTIWLRCAEIDPSGYANLAAVIADTTARTTLCNNKNALRYMVRSTSVIMPAVLANSGWVSALDSSTYAIHTPTMTSNTLPSGEVIYHSNNATAYLPYQAFDKNAGTYGGSSSGATSHSLTGEYLGYLFDNSIYFYKSTITTVSYGTGGASATWSLQYSQDKTNWLDAVTGISILHNASSTKTFISNGYGMRWIITSSSSYPACSANEIEFYGLNLA